MKEQKPDGIGKFRPNAGKIKYLRAQRNWNQEALASKARISLRTVQNIETGKVCARDTLWRIAEALKCQWWELVDGDLNKTTSRQFRITTYLQLSINYDELDQCEQLLSLIDHIEKIVKSVNGFTIEKIQKGSSIISVSIDAAEMPRLLASYYFGRLDSLGVEDIFFDLGVKYFLINPLPMLYIRPNHQHQLRACHHDRIRLANPDDIEMARTLLPNELSD